MRFLGRIIKYLLRSAFSIIVFLLVVGLAKMKWDVNSYIVFLNDNDRSVFHRSQPATWGDPFRPGRQTTGDISDLLTWDEATTESSGLDVYDPQMEQDLNTFTDWSLSGTETDYGFTTGWQAASDTGDSSDSASKSDLLNLIKQKELPK